MPITTGLEIFRMRVMVRAAAPAPYGLRHPETELLEVVGPKRKL